MKGSLEKKMTDVKGMESIPGQFGSRDWTSPAAVLLPRKFHALVPTLRVGTQVRPLCGESVNRPNMNRGRRIDAERRDVRSHAERGNEFGEGEERSGDRA